MVASSKDVAVIAGIGLIALIILKSGRDLFGALGTLKIPDINITGLPGLPKVPGIPNIFNTFNTNPEVTEPTPNPVTGEFFDPKMGDVPLTASEVATVIQEPSIIDKILGRDPTNIEETAPSKTITETGPEPIGAKSVADLLAKIAARDSGLTPAQQFAQDERGATFSVQSNILDKMFRGGGSGFIGGSVSEIPISGLSLGDISERFQVTASQAADIKARAKNDFDGFDFGTNTGSGIGSVVSENPLIRQSLPNPGQVSDSAFAGLSANEIFKRITGGLISNF